MKKHAYSAESENAMGTVLGIASDLWNQTDAKEKTGFRLPPAGTGILWEIYGHRLGTFEKNDETREYLQILVQMTDDDGEEYKHSIFFGLGDREDIANLKFFFEKIDQTDFNPERDELETLEGVTFFADFQHYKKRSKGPDGQPEIGGNIVLNSIVPNTETRDVNTEKPSPRKRLREVADEEEHEEIYYDDEPEQPPMRRRRVRMATSDKD